MGNKMETDQFATLMAAVAIALPRDMDSTTAQGWITNPKALEKTLRAALMPSETALNAKVRAERPKAAAPADPERLTLGARTYELWEPKHGAAALREGRGLYNGGEQEARYFMSMAAAIPAWFRQRGFSFADEKGCWLMCYKGEKGWELLKISNHNPQDVISSLPHFPHRIA